MDYDALIERWLTIAPPHESAARVESVLAHYFGTNALHKDAGSSHQLHIKDSRLAGLPGFGIGGHLTVPISGGQRVKRVYLRRIAQAAALLKRLEAEQ